MDLTQLIAQVGFPIAVAAWLLVKMEKQLEEAAEAARHLAALLEAHLARCQECQERRFGLLADDARRPNETAAAPAKKASVILADPGVCKPAPLQANTN